MTTEAGAHAAQVHSQTERNYTIILGSHRNTCLKVEKDGQLCEAVRLNVSQLCVTMVLLASFNGSQANQGQPWPSTLDSDACAGGVRTRRPAFKDEVHAVLDHVPVG